MQRKFSITGFLLSNDSTTMVRNMGEMKTIREQIQGFPTGPGLYFMKGAKEEVLYIGKAKNLRSRVASYFQPASDIMETRGPKIVEMLNKVETVDYIETETEVDAMLKEARLIKDIRPPYNTDLIDDKTFPYLEITTGDDFPGVYITRTPRAKGKSTVWAVCQRKGFAGGIRGTAEDIQIQKLHAGYPGGR